MIALIADNLESIQDLCRTHGIRILDQFGSAATGAFNPETSDLDFIVDLGGYEPSVSRRFNHFATAKVDLIADKEIENPFFRESVRQQMVNVYGAGNRQVAA
ncbi:MAG: nucleotidyltransferase domain-containing protein [Chloroflexia bacterium]|nr:nucleotidyltransferase domain-containing protein [Chloroflexia bacterium]